MNDPLIPFFKPLTALGLSHTKREALRTRLALYTDMHPIEMTETVSESTSGFFALITSRRFSGYALALLILVGIGGTATFAAEGSVPGETLYALKIHVNEPLMTAFAPTNTGQARVAARLATRRVDEAVVLASKGRLTSEKRLYLAEAFDTQVKKTRERVTILANAGDAEGAATVQADFAANLAGEAQALGAVAGGQTDGAKDETTQLLSVIVATAEGADVSGEVNPEGSVDGNGVQTTGALLGPDATTTPKTHTRTRFRRGLNIASSTFSSGVILDTPDLHVPHADVAIPRVQSSDKASLFERLQHKGKNDPLNTGE